MNGSYLAASEPTFKLNRAIAMINLTEKQYNFKIGYTPQENEYKFCS